MTDLLTWKHRVAEIAEAGVHKTRKMTPIERDAIARALDILACDDVKASYSVRALGNGRYRFPGNVLARLTQKCIVTLEAVPRKLEESFNVEFWPAEALPAPTDTEVEVIAAVEIEPIDNGVIDAGRVIFETLAASLDPYPRKPNAEFVWKIEKGTDPAAAGPFAGLSSLKDKQ